MIFNTWLFAGFGIVTFLLYWFVIPRGWRPGLIAFSGIVFYSASVPAYTLLIAALGMITFATIRCLLALGEQKIVARRIVLSLGIFASVGVLFFFKYLKFFAFAFDRVCHGGCSHTMPDLIVPLAVSFFTFEFVHVLIDVYLGKIKQMPFRNFWIFTLFFPTMVAGPIKRYQNFAPQIAKVTTRVHLNQFVFAAGVFRILLGLAKKTIIADSMSPLTQPLLTPGPLYGYADYVVGVLAYSAKIYFDFTGYSDMAIGCAALLGFQILENFDRPYWSENISVFWRRWHISLSSWIRDYIFIPLGGSRRGSMATIINLAFVMALAGLWHGAAWHFVAWGLWHGLGLAVHRLWLATVARRLYFGGAWRPLSVGFTFSFAALGWVLFACPDLATAMTIYATLFHLPGIVLLGTTIFAYTVGA